MNSPVPSFLEAITRDKAAVLTQTWDDCEGIPHKTGLMRIARQTSLDFRIVRYWFYCRSNYEGIARAFNALEPRQKLEFPKLEEYYLFDRFMDDLDAPDTTDPTPQALGPPQDAIATSNQQSQPAHAQVGPFSSVSTRGRVRRATMKKQQLDALGDSHDASSASNHQSQPASQGRVRRACTAKKSAIKKKQQQLPTQEPNENGKRRQDPAIEDREVKAASKARTKRPKISTSATPPPTETTTEARSILSMTTATPAEMDSAPSLSADTTQETVALTSSPSAGAADVNMADVTAVANCDPSSAAPSTRTSVNSKTRQPRMFVSAVVIPPYKRPSGSSSPTSSRRRHITVLRLPPSTFLKKRSKSAPLSVSRGDEPESKTTPELEGSRERVLSDGGQDDEDLFESESHLSAADIAPVPVQKETLGARAGDRMVGEAEEKAVNAMEDQEEGHLGTVYLNPFISSMANSSLQPRTRNVSNTSEGGVIVQGDQQNERFPEQPRSARLSRFRVYAPDNGARSEPTHNLTAQHGVADDAPGGEANGLAATINGQQDRSIPAQQLWDQPWTKQYASIPMKHRNRIVESGIASSPSRSSQSASITSCITSFSNSANNTMVPDERIASVKKIVSMPTPKSTDDTERQAKTTQSKELRESKINDSRQCEHEENLKAVSTPMFPNERPYVEAQADEMDGDGSSYSHDATYNCLSPTNSYHSDDFWSEVEAFGA
ncbi:hypothetical protein BGZ75_005341 [Mortierella antarctica]|nr:hypothetical protein BGZ75_005341 [Mortierella antarctica]